MDKKLAQRVHRAAQELQYQPNRLARNLRRRAGSIWAILVSDIENPFFTSLVRGVEDVALDKGFSIVLCNTDESPEREARYVEVVLAEQVAGVILSPASGDSDIEPLLRHRVPVVTVDRHLPGGDVDAVLVDNREGAHKATMQLLEAGYQRVACVSGPMRVMTAVERLAGYRAALRSMVPSFGDLEAENALVSYGNFRVDGGYAATASLLQLPHPPDALFVANNLMAAGALAAVRDHGLHVPDEIGVAAFDDTPWAPVISPALTVVAQPAREVGQTAAMLLIRRLNNPAAPQETVALGTELRIRESSGGVARQGHNTGYQIYSDFPAAN